MSTGIDRTRDVRCFGILHSVERYFRTDVSGNSIVPIFKDQAVFLDCLTLEDGNYRLCRNVGMKLPFYAT